MEHDELVRAFLANRDERCPQCRYNLRGVQTPVCPECAAPLVLTFTVAKPSQLTRRLTACAGFTMFLWSASSLAAYLVVLGIKNFASTWWLAFANVSASAVALTIAVGYVASRGRQHSRDSRWTHAVLVGASVTALYLLTSVIQWVWYSI
jgi:hypothetical protein